MKLINGNNFVKMMMMIRSQLRKPFLLTLWLSSFLPVFVCFSRLRCSSDGLELTWFYALLEIELVLHWQIFDRSLLMKLLNCSWICLKHSLLSSLTVCCWAKAGKNNPWDQKLRFYFYENIVEKTFLSTSHEWILALDCTFRNKVLKVRRKHVEGGTCYVIK